MIYKHGLPAIQQFLARMGDYDQLHEYPGSSGREYKLMTEMARQHGMGMSENRMRVAHTPGANEQFVIAGSGQRPPPPGHHRMSTGEIMPNEPEQQGGSPFLFGPGAQITGVPVDMGAVNTSGIAPGVLGSFAGALGAAMGLNTGIPGKEWALAHSAYS